MTVKTKPGGRGPIRFLQQGRNPDAFSVACRSDYARDVVGDNRIAEVSEAFPLYAILDAWGDKLCLDYGNKSHGAPPFPYSRYINISIHFLDFLVDFLVRNFFLHEDTKRKDTEKTPGPVLSVYLGD